MHSLLQLRWAPGGWRVDGGWWVMRGRGGGGGGCGLGNWVVDGAKIVLGAPVVKVSALGRACSGTWRHPPHLPHLPQRHKIIAAPDRTPEKTLEVHPSIGSSCLRRAENVGNNNPRRQERACFFADTERKEKRVPGLRSFGS